MSRRTCRGEPPTITRLVVIFMLAALGTFVLCAVGQILAQRHAALREAVRDARATGVLVADRVAGPVLPSSAATGFEDGGEFDRVVCDRVLRDPVSRVEVLDGDAGLLYSTEPAAGRSSSALTSAELMALRTTSAVAELDDGSDPARLLAGRRGQHLVVSVGVRSPSGQPADRQGHAPRRVVPFLSSG